MKKVFLILLALLLLSLSGCGEAAREQVPADGYRGLTFVSEETMDSFREPLKRFCMNLYENARDTDDFVIDVGYGLSLLDVNFDGIPEVAVNRGGGTMGVLLFDVYDLYTHEPLGSFMGGYEEDPCVYYNVETDELCLIQQYPIRFGWESMKYLVEELSFSYTVSQDTLFRVDRTMIGNEEGGWSPEITFSINGEDADDSEYFYEYQSFFRTHIRIPETAHRCIYWWDLEGYDEKDSEKGVEALFDEMADILLNGDQLFLRAVPASTCRLSPCFCIT